LTPGRPGRPVRLSFSLSFPCLILLSDFDLTASVVNDKDACYILYRTDLQNSQGDYLWYLLRYVPDKAKAQQAPAAPPAQKQ